MFHVKLIELAIIENKENSWRMIHQFWLTALVSKNIKSLFALWKFEKATKMWILYTIAVGTAQSSMLGITL